MKWLGRIVCSIRGAHKYRISVHRGKKYINPWCCTCGKMKPFSEQFNNG